MWFRPRHRPREADLTLPWVCVGGQKLTRLGPACVSGRWALARHMRVLRTPLSFKCRRSLRSSHRFCSGGLRCTGTSLQPRAAQPAGDAALYLLRLVLRDVMQGAVRVQADPHHPHREFGRSLVGFQLGGWNDQINQSESRRSNRQQNNQRQRVHRARGFQEMA